MKILLINKFLYPKGGDAISTLATGKLLADKGHKVTFWGMDNPETPGYVCKKLFVSYIDYNNPGGLINQTKTALNLLYSFEARKKIEQLIKVEKPDIAHLNNFAHQISPSILPVLRKYNIPAVMAMRDYKLVCPTYSMLLKNNPCERCKGGRYIQCLINRCAKNSYAKSLLNTVEMYLHHKILRIYDLIDIYISPSQFLKEKVAEMGFKGEIVYLPNFVYPEEFTPNYGGEENSIVYFGRLSAEKGLNTLVEAVKGLNIKLKIIGEGPLRSSLEHAAGSQELRNVEFLGYKTGEELKDEISKSMFAVLPSQCYENNPRSIIEGFALGKPAIGARIGGIPELVKDGITGLTFEPGNAADLRSTIEYFINNPDKIKQMGKNAKEFADKELNPQKHYDKLMQIYEMAIEKKAK